MELFSRRTADGTGTDERLLSRAKSIVDFHADGWSPAGSHVLFTEVSPASPTNQCAIGQIPMERSSDATVLVKNDSCNQFSALSPNRLWMASSRACLAGKKSMSSGIRRWEVGRKFLRMVVCCRSGRVTVGNSFFGGLDGRQMFVVPIQSGTTLVAGRPEVLFDTAMMVGSRMSRSCPGWTVHRHSPRRGRNRERHGAKPHPGAKLV